MDLSNPPAGWGNDELSNFLDSAHFNSYVNFRKRHPLYDRLSKIHDALGEAIEAAGNTSKPFSLVLLLRAHASYLAAARLALAGQVCESFMVQRGALEAAMYGQFISGNLGARKKWLNRNVDDRALSEMRNKFQIRAILSNLAGVVPEIGSSIRLLYETTIDWGAHPNPRGVMGTMHVEGQDDRFNLELYYLTDDETQIELALVSTARVGIAVLKLFGLVYPQRFRIACLDTKTQRLSDGL